MIDRLSIAAAVISLATLAGCHSHIVPLQPVTTREVWIVDPASPTTQAATETASMPATMASTEPATVPATLAATEPSPATQPGHKEIVVVDPNQTVRYIYKATYDNVWDQSMRLLYQMGFQLDEQSYRLGRLSTLPLPSPQIVEPWKPAQAGVSDMLENTLNDQRRIARLMISKVPGKPDFYEIAIQVVVQRITNPTEALGGPIFIEGSGFGRNAAALRSDYITPTEGPPEKPRWIPIGHDTHLEKKMLDLLFKRI